MKSKIDSILQNHSWELVDLPPGCKLLGYKWIFKKKMKSDGIIDKYKARLVIKGFRQREDKILNTHNARNSGLARTPIDTSLHLSKNRGVSVSQLEYSRIIGMLMYLMTSTRPDLAYAISRLSRYTSNPSNAHWKAITRVLHYLRYNRDYGLHYDRHPAVIEGYSDANWISDINDSRSTSGFVSTLGGAAISWMSSKQTVIAKSTMESEFIALDKCGEEAKWLCQFVEDIPRWPKPVTAISIHCDSQSAIGRAQSTMYNGKSRHIRR
nr:zinc finger, CCHC-type [Tanacetum cinerariifolium]